MIYESNNIKIYLASNSPRRRELLAATGIDFEVISSFGENIPFKFKSPRYYAEKKAELKLEHTLKASTGIKGCIITADTIVVRKGKIIEKPITEEDAIKILKYLEGKWHTVITAYCMHINNDTDNVHLVRSCKSKVKFKHLTLREILNYVATKEPMDKSGAYAMQGFGAFMIEQIEGSYTNIVGLPLTQLISDLLKLKVIKAR